MSLARPQHAANLLQWLIKTMFFSEGILAMSFVTPFLLLAHDSCIIWL